MIQTNKNLKNTNLKNVRFIQMDANNIIFPDYFFDVVTTRHCVFNPKEVFRILKEKGIFMSQQVEIGDKQNIKDFFKRGQLYNETGLLMNTYRDGLLSAGFTEVMTDLYDAKELYQSEDDLLILLKNAPIIPDFGTSQGDYELFNNFITKFKSKKGIITNSKRSIIVARK